jgi:hypothetical protein
LGAGVLAGLEPAERAAKLGVGSAAASQAIDVGGADSRVGPGAAAPATGGGTSNGVRVVARGLLRVGSGTDEPPMRCETGWDGVDVLVGGGSI